MPRSGFAIRPIRPVSIALPASFDYDSAPDAVSRAILQSPLERLDAGAQAGVDPYPALHANFQRAIEQNFARLTSASTAKLLDGMTDAELSDLAQLYAKSASDTGRNQRLLTVLAHRLDGARLGRVSAHFGFAPTYEAVTNVAASKSQDFINSSNVNYSAPVANRLRIGSANPYFKAERAVVTPMLFRPQAVHGAFIKTQAGWGQFLNYTPNEIYLTFRTAPIGSLDVIGALWETSVILSQAAMFSFGTGYAIGTMVIGPLIQTYAPSLWDAIGGTLSNIINDLSTGLLSGDTITAGVAEMISATSFNTPPIQWWSFAETIGDFSVSEDFNFMWANSPYGGNNASCWSAGC